MGLFGNRCAACGKKGEMCTETEGVDMGVYNTRMVSSLWRCTKCNKWFCNDHHEYHTPCTPASSFWKHEVDERERKKREEEDRLYRERVAQELDRRQRQEAENARRSQETVKVERRCHICYAVGSYSASQCTKCGKWACQNDWHKGVCRRCHGM